MDIDWSNRERPPRRGGTRAGGRGHGRQRVLISAATVAVVLLAVFSITALRDRSDRARVTQLTVAGLGTEAQRLSRIEWQATAERDVEPMLAEEFDGVDARLRAGLERLRGDDREAFERLDAPARRFLAAIDAQLNLVAAGRIEASEAIEEEESNPSFAALEGQLARVDLSERRSAETEARRTDLGITASLFVAAMVLVGLLWRLDAIKNIAVAQRQRSLEEQAMHDSLTGLPNRRKLMNDLADALAATGDRAPNVLVMCDLDGFKPYNDTFGHPEGDLLLARLGAALAASVRPYGVAYRLGGDEFCALVRADADNLPAILEACRAALSERGAGFDVQTSLGPVRLDTEADDPSGALRLADERMYAEKQDRGVSTRQQLRDLALRLLAEHDPDLFDHVSHVGGLAAGVGRRLGLDDARVAQLVRAAELHDIGKVAIPDSIFHKPGALNAEEQEFVRRHTIIGEAIVSVAPALAGIGGLIRASHERYDGAGYPDGIAGEEIPLASRIIFVCDSFDAMTSWRRYREARSVGAAVEELRRCAGTQFDPRVVDAFTAELEATGPPEPRGGGRGRSPQASTT